MANMIQLVCRNLKMLQFINVSIYPTGIGIKRSPLTCLWNYYKRFQHLR